MSKKILTVIAVLMMAILAFAGCESTKWGPVTGASANDAVVGNGGFLVEKGDYIYFVNGLANSTADNKFGNPVQGSIVVANKNNLNETPKIVVPKIIAAGDKTSGIYIFGDWIYYATPNSDKDKDGTIQNSYLDFARTKLDGTKTEKVVYTSSNSTVYRYAEIDGVVYLCYYDSTAKNVITYNFDTKKTTTLVEAPVAYSFSNDENYGYVYYTKVVVLDEENEINATYNKVYKQSFAGGDPVEVLSGVPKTADNGAVSSNGLVFTVLGHQNGMLAYTVAYVDNKTFRGGYVLLDKDVTTNPIANAEEKAHKLCATEKNFSSSVVLGFDAQGNNLGFVYSDTTYGLMRYVYDETTGEGKTIRMNDSTSTTLVMVKDGYVYYSTGDAFVRLAITAEETDVKEAETITKTLYSTSWYKPEFVGNNLFYCDSTSSRNYIYYMDMTAETKEGKFIGIYTKADQEAVDKEAETED